MTRRLVLLCAVAVVVAAPAAASAAAPASCGAVEPDVVVTGELSGAQMGSFVLVPFDVPAGTTAVRASYCYDRADAKALPGYPVDHTLDFGLYEPRPAGQRLWSQREFRGWSGSGFRKDITVSPEGYVTDGDPLKRPVGATSRGYRPGPIPAGRWAAELGVAAVVGQDLGDADGKVAYRVEVVLSRDPAFADDPYRPAPYDERAGKPDELGWYVGDLHVHTEHSGDASARNVDRQVFDDAFGPGGAGLDFVQVTDHNTDPGWGEWGRLQARYPGKVIGRSEELTTYAGHLGTPGIGEIVDYRVGPVLERLPDGSLAELRPRRAVNELLRDVHRTGGVTTINHPTIFDSDVPAFANLCRGCSWEYGDTETGYADVDAIEVAGSTQGLRVPGVQPGPNPFTPLALDFLDTAVRLAGHPIAAVGGSDSHSGGDVEQTDPIGTPVGRPATAVFANELTERGIAEAVRAGHTYVKLFGPAGPDLRFNARTTVKGQALAMMGDTVNAPSARFTARVLGSRGAGPEPLELVVLRNGRPMSTRPVAGPETTLLFTADAPATGFDSYRLQLQRGSAIEAVSSPILLAGVGTPFTPHASAEVPGTSAPLRARALLGRRFTASRGRVAVRCRAAGTDLRACRIRLRARSGRRIVTLATGTATMTPGTTRIPLRTTSAGRRLLRRKARLRVTVTVTAVAADGRTATSTRRATLHRR